MNVESALTANPLTGMASSLRGQMGENVGQAASARGSSIMLVRFSALAVGAAS